MTKNYWPFALIAIVAVILFSIGYKSLKNDDWNKVPQNSTAIEGQEIPSYSNFVTDNAEIIDFDAEQTLNQKLEDFNNAQKGQIAVLTVKNLNGLSIEEFAIRVAEKWMVGHKGIDNGVIIIISTDERKVRIEVGRGTAITDSQAGVILTEKMVPKLKRSDWIGGINDGVDEVIKLMNK